MSESNSTSEAVEAVVYVKGDSERVAKSASQRVALAFDGYKPKVAESVETPAPDAPVEVAKVDEAPKPVAPVVKPAPPVKPVKDNA